MSQQQQSGMDVSKVYNSTMMQKFKSIAVDQNYKKMKNTIKGNGLNPLKWCSTLTRWTLHIIFSSVFKVIGVFLGALALPFGKWKKAATKNRFNSVYTMIDTISRVLEGIIVLVVESIVRLLLSPTWWWTAIRTARRHSDETQISFKDALSLCAAESFLIVVEHAFRANFGDVKKLNEKNRSLRT